MIINIILVLSVLILSAYYCYREYKKCENILEETLFIMLFISCFLPVCIYYLDRFNIPTFFKCTENINTQNWLSFLSTYSTGIISAFIGGLLLILITFIQINKNSDDIRKRDREERRINNLPLLEYEFDNGISCNNIVTIDTSFNDDINSINKNIILSIKNIGINAVKKCYVTIDSELFLHKYTFSIGPQGCINKDDKKSITFIFKVDNKISTIIKYKVHYQDLLSNWYEQDIEMNYDLEKDTYKLKINPEKYLKKEPNLKLNI